MEGSMKSFKNHLNEQRELQEAGPLALIPIALGAFTVLRTAAPVVARFSLPLLRLAGGRTAGGVAVRAGAGAGVYRYGGEDGQENLTKDVGTVINFIAKAATGKDELVSPGTVRFIASNLAGITGAMLVLGLTVPASISAIRRALRSRGIYQDIQHELDQGDIRAARAILSDALSRADNKISLRRIKKIMTARDFDVLTKGIESSIG